MGELTAGHWRAPTPPWQALGERGEDETIAFSARRAGRAACRAERGRDSCPHAMGSRARVDWLAGWWAENNGVEE